MTIVSRTDIKNLLSTLYRKKFFTKRIEMTDALMLCVRASVATPSVPLRCLYLWGIHQKGKIDALDIAALSHIARLIKHIEQHFCCSVALDIVLCDTHAKLNQVSDEKAETYAIQISDYIRSNYSWNINVMSNVWDRHNINLVRIRERAESMRNDQWTSVSCRNLLLASATKYYLGCLSEEGAKMYYIARMLEKDAIGMDFNGYIHITSADSRLEELQPGLPEFKIWSIRRGCSVKPWFVTASEAALCAG